MSKAELQVFRNKENAFKFSHTSVAEGTDFFLKEELCGRYEEIRRNYEQI